MKSYLRFLSRNKLYTAIEVVGLSIALAFVIVLGSYLLEDLNCDKSIRNAEEVYVLRWSLQTGRQSTTQTRTIISSR